MDKKKGIITSCRTKRQLYKLCQITNDVNFKSYYETYTNILRNIIVKTKCNMNFISNAKNKGKAIWDAVKRETGKKSENENKTIQLFLLFNTGTVYTVLSVLFIISWT